MHVIGQLMQYLKTRSDEDYLESVMGCFASPVVSKLKCENLDNGSSFAKARSKVRVLSR